GPGPGNFDNYNFMYEKILNKYKINSKTHASFYFISSCQANIVSRKKLDKKSLYFILFNGLTGLGPKLTGPGPDPGLAHPGPGPDSRKKTRPGPGPGLDFRARAGSGPQILPGVQACLPSLLFEKSGL